MMVTWIESFVGVRARQAKYLLCGAGLIAAYWVRFVQDDAFISYRYAKNAARGHGFVFNEGDRVEGYTNFLWTALHVIPEKLQWSSPWFSIVLGLCVFAGTLVAVARLASLVFQSEAKVLLTLAVLVANMTFLLYGSSGLETMLQTGLLLCCAIVAIEHVIPEGEIGADLGKARVLSGLAAAGALLTRLDSAVLIATWFLATLWHVWGSSDRAARPKNMVVASLQLGALPLLICGPWMLWKIDYYGNLLPNTFYAKSAGSPLTPLLYGVAYLLFFFLTYGAFLLIGRARRVWPTIRSNQRLWVLMVSLPVWGAYICYVGADFMEYRFMVPVLPVLGCIAAEVINPVRSRGRQLGLISVLLLFSLLHRVLPFTGPNLGIPLLNHWPTESSTSWYAMGEALQDAFPNGQDVKRSPQIAVAPAGVIPYVSDLPTVDMLGLSEPKIAREGDTLPIYFPGHVRMATVEQLQEREANLVVGLPLLERTAAGEEPRSEYLLSDLVLMWPGPDLSKLPTSAEIIEIPLDEGVSWAVISLVPSGLVDTAVKERGWRRVPIAHRCDLDGANPVIKRFARKTCDQV